jgi:hypothetical protein
MEDLCADIVKSSKQSLGKTLKNVTDLVTELKAEIIQDDKRFENAVKERQMMDIIKQSNRGGGEELIVFTKQKR